MTKPEKDIVIGKGVKINIAVTVVNTLLLVALLLSLKSGVFKREGPPASSSIRDSAASLEARGLYWATLSELERYRDSGTLDPEEEAGLLYKMGTIADQKLADCPRALTYYTLAASLDPGADWANDANKACVVCLEKQGNKQQAQALLNQLTAGDGLRAAPAEKSVAGPVVAVIDGRSVSWQEVLEHQQLNFRGQDLNDPKARDEIVQHYVYVLLMVDEAVKKGYANDPEIGKMLVQTQRQALAREFMKREGIDITDQETMRKLRDGLTRIHEVKIFKFTDANAEDK